ncbi:MAG: serine hydrolase [Ignavibacteriaceae bacterium]
MKKIIATALIAIFFTYPAVHAQDKNSSALDQKANELLGLVHGNPGGYEKYFSKDFLSQVPAEKLTSIIDYLISSYGKCLRVEQASLNNPFSGKYNFIFEKNVSVPVDITVDQSAPNLIIGLWMGSPVSLSGSFDDIIKELKSLPGETSLLVEKISGDKPEPIASYNPDRELAIGSSFKLYILSELLRTINNGTRSLTDIVKLQPAAISLPSGFLQNWPIGSPFTIYTLAGLMISQSDNTAADQLLYYSGRQNVEKMLAVTGHSNPSLDIPFLSTFDMFRLKGQPGLEAAHEFLSKTGEERREILSNVVPQISRDSLVIGGQPVYVDSIEWFASANDLCAVMNWIRLNSIKAPGSEFRNILSINPGLSISKKSWQYVGYKGGSEAGVLNMTYLLQSVNGDWYALSAGWNNTKAPLEEVKFFRVVGKAIQLIK